MCAKPVGTKPNFFALSIKLKENFEWSVETKQVISFDGVCKKATSNSYHTNPVRKSDQLVWRSEKSF